jgi:hypothetical protein
VTLEAPMKVGRSWDGSWNGDVSGDYEAAVTDKTSVVTGAGSVEAFKIFSVTNFRGDFQGRAYLTAWVDPDTLQVVKTKGFVKLKSSFGSYATKFETLLQDGPG